ncbi:MAG: hypothetical protein HS111_03965 [Kofleriaceae bacterium]|nr:hypothetical protein [Kofleriaceae bacterium]MCL4228060.1 hypothetical protein [Myxococcales bacterium]
MGSKIITKTDRAMEDQLLAVANDPERADTLAKARAFKRTWLELADALARVQKQASWQRWGFTDFEAYCRKELHLRRSTVDKLLGSYRFLESSAPKVLERARSQPSAPVPSLAAVEFVEKATARGAADEETLANIRRVAFDEGAEAPLLKRTFKEVAFPEEDVERAERLRGQIAGAARRLSALIAEEGAPVSRSLAVRVEETVGELLAALEEN